MTIYTTEVKKKTQDEIPDVKTVLMTEMEAPEAVPARQLPIRQRRKTGFCTTCLVCILACLMVAGGVIGGMFLFQHFTKGRFAGRCAVTYKSHELHFDGAVAMPQYETDYPDDEYTMNEDVEVDTAEHTETITVPVFDDNNPATILHDFNRELTAYKDLLEGHCYVMKLNTSAILPPKNFVDLLLKIRDGSYIPKADTIRRTMVVLQPAVEDVDQFGMFISYLCWDVPTYQLVKVTDLIESDYVKRSAEQPKLTCKTSSKIIFYSGKYLIADELCWQ
ncbi:integral membrane protein 2B-like [Ptychodera flava]|uniref:integral membrane protein 2B-like n=1 Tax=Ptychodera flava TaxID=63121 RepID=UPI003969F250